MNITAFYSDPHYGHRNILEYADRPFSSIEEHDRELILRYNSVVQNESDVVLWLGDCFLCSMPRAQEIMGKLRGTKLLIMGNHDLGHSVHWFARLGFLVVESGQVVFNLDDLVLRACHFPHAGAKHVSGNDDRYLELRPPHRKGEILVHGHTHSRIRLQNNCIHAGVDAWDYKPVLLEQVRDLLNAR